MPETSSQTLPLPDFVSTAVFSLIVAYVLVAFVYIVVRGLSGRRRVAALVGIVLWLAAAGIAASSGVLSRSGLPPPMVGVFAGMVSLSLLFALSSWGRQVGAALALWILIAVQAFRLPLELTMHHWADLGTFPIEMTFTGYNYDIVAGIGAVVVGAVTCFRGRAARPLAIAYNAMGLTLLAVIAVVSVGSVPTPFAYMNASVPLTLPSRFPFVWLPAVCVAFALICHVISLRQWLGKEPAPGATARLEAP